MKWPETIAGDAVREISGGYKPARLFKSSLFRAKFPLVALLREWERRAGKAPVGNDQCPLIIVFLDAPSA
jgi:hypothetical protein